MDIAKGYIHQPIGICLCTGSFEQYKLIKSFKKVTNLSNCYTHYSSKIKLDFEEFDSNDKKDKFIQTNFVCSFLCLQTNLVT